MKLLNDDGSDLEKSSELIEMTKKFPTAAFVAGRLKEVGSLATRNLFFIIGLFDTFSFWAHAQ